MHTRKSRRPSYSYTHEYTLLRDAIAGDDGTFIPDDIAISMGRDGVMDAIPVNDRGENPAASKSGERLNVLAKHNIAEMERAMEESGKWKTRLKESPLGKTQQDFVAYYTEVISAFEKWCTAHGIPIRYGGT